MRAPRSDAEPKGAGHAPSLPRLAVVGINYAPELTGIAPYTSQFATALGLECDVEMITGVEHYPSWTVPRAHRWRLRSRERSQGVGVRRLRHFVPRRQDALRRGWYEASFALQVGLTRADRPDVVVAVVPTLLSAVVAAWLARRAGARFVVWVQDAMSAAAAQSGLAGGSRVAAAVRRAERYVFRRADHVVIVSEAFRRTVQDAGVSSDHISLIPNWVHVSPPTADRAMVRTSLGWRPDQLVILHTGNIGLKQDLLRVVETARTAARTDPDLRFVIMGDGSQRQSVAKAAAGLDNLELCPPVAEERYADVLAAADVLLLNERAGLLDMSLPSKLTSYLFAGRPVVACVDSASASASLVRQSGGGVVTIEQTPTALLESLRGFRDFPDSAELLGRRGHRFATEELSAATSLARLRDVVLAPALLAVR